MTTCVAKHHVLSANLKLYNEARLKEYESYATSFGCKFGLLRYLMLYSYVGTLYQVGHTLALTPDNLVG